MDLLLSDVTGDLVFTDDFDFQTIDSTEELRQRLIIKLRTYQGELFYNTEFGTPYYQSIFGKKNDINVIESVIKAAIVESSGVKKLLEFSMDYTNETRSLVVTFKVQLFDDSELVVTEVTL